MKKQKLIPILEDYKYKWSYCSLGGEIRVKISSGEDLGHLDELDRKMWTVISCPVDGLDFDPTTLSYLDSDSDGTIKVGEVVSAAKWLYSAVKDKNSLLRGEDCFELDGFDDASEVGAILKDASSIVLSNLGKDSSRVSIGDCSDMTAIFSGTAFNGDGVISLLSTQDEGLRRAISLCMKAMGTVKDISGEEGVDADAIKAFYTALEQWREWKDEALATPAILPYGADTQEALSACEAINDKVRDYFMRCKMIAFDEDVSAAMDVSVDSLEAVAGSIIADTTPQVLSAPLARPGKKAVLPFDGINPAWKAAFDKVYRLVLSKEFACVNGITEEQWENVLSGFSSYRKWMSEKRGEAVASLPDEVVCQLLADGSKDALLALVEKDMERSCDTENIRQLDKFLHLYRDFYKFLLNYVNFTEFYTLDKNVRAAFESGDLYIDQRCCRLCIDVKDASAHADMATLSGMFLIYCACTCRNSGKKKDIVAVMTAGAVRNVRPGTHAVYCDRSGVDWDAVVTKVVDNPISVGQAFWTPYRKFCNFISEKVNKFFSDKDSKVLSELDASAQSAVAAPASGGNAPASSPFDIAKFAGIFAAIGMAIGYIGAFFTELVSGIATTTWFEMLKVIVGLMLCISGPSCLIAAFKLHKRNLGPVLNANGWAINADIKVNILFGATLTSVANYPKLNVTDPFAGKKTPLWKKILYPLLILAAVIGILYFFGVFEFAKPVLPASSGDAATQTEQVEQNLQSSGNE